MTTQPKAIAVRPNAPEHNAFDRARPVLPRPSAVPVNHFPLGYRINDACRAAGLGRTSIYKLIADGKLKVVKMAGRTLIVGDSLRAYFSLD